MAISLGDLVIRLNAQTTAFDRKMARSRRTLGMMSGAARSLAAAFLPLSGAAGFAAVARSGEEFNRKMNNSLAIMKNVSTVMRTDMKQAAFDVARTTQFSASQAAESYYFLASAGLDAKQSIAALPQVAAFAQAGQFDLARATDLATDAQSALGLTVSDSAANLKNLTKVTDVLIKANTLANASAEQFSEALTTKSGAALRSVGKTIEEGVAVLAAFADQGIKGAEAGTALQIVMRDLQTKAIQNAAAFKQARVAVFDAKGEMRNMADIVADLESHLSGLSDESQKSALMTLGFTDKSIAFAQALIGVSEKIRGYEAELMKAGGTTKDVADKQLTPLQKGLAEIGAAATEAGAAMMEAFGPTLEKALRSTAKEISSLQKILGKWEVLLGKAIEGGYPREGAMGTKIGRDLQRQGLRRQGEWDKRQRGQGQPVRLAPFATPAMLAARGALSKSAAAKARFSGYSQRMTFGSVDVSNKQRAAAAAGLGKLFARFNRPKLSDEANRTLQGLGQKLGGLFGGATTGLGQVGGMAGGALGGALGGLARPQAAPQAAPQFAGAMAAGSSQAWSTVLAAMGGGGAKDPTTREVKEMRKSHGTLLEKIAGGIGELVRSTAEGLDIPI